MKVLKNFRLDEKTVKVLAAASKRTGKTMTKILEEAIREKLATKS